MKLTRIHYEIIKFIIVGGINTFNYYITYLFLLKVLHVNYMVSQIVNMVMQTLLLYIFVKWLNIASEIAPFAGLIITIPVTFILSKWLLRDKV